MNFATWKPMCPDLWSPPPLQFSALPPVRVVFAITMEGSARKVITVRSALMVRNRLEVPMELRLDSPSAPDSKARSTSRGCSLYTLFWSLAANGKDEGIED